MSLWDSVKAKASVAGSAAVLAGKLTDPNLQRSAVTITLTHSSSFLTCYTGKKTKTTTSLLLIDREITARQQAFGVQLYDYVSPMASDQDFYASEDQLTTTLRPPLLTAQREIAALTLKQQKIKEAMAQAEVDRAAAFPTAAVTWTDSIKNAGKSAGLGANEAKLKTEASMLESRIKGHKQQFGVDLFATLVELEDSQGWLPTDREIRSIYDLARKDIESIKARRAEKEREREALSDSETTEW